MKLHELKPGTGSSKKGKRVGRGMSSGHGKTSGRGQKGQLSRSGGGKGTHFEGGQTPLMRRLPKLPGFKNRFKKVFSIVNVERLNIFDGKEDITPENLLEKGLIRTDKYPVKILGNGSLEKKLNISAHHFTGSAKEKIEAAGGKIEVIT